MEPEIEMYKITFYLSFIRLLTKLSVFGIRVFDNRSSLAILRILKAFLKNSSRHVHLYRIKGEAQYLNYKELHEYCTVQYQQGDINTHFGLERIMTRKIPT